MTLAPHTYEALLSATRLQPSRVPGRDLVAESESDRARFVFSAPFRRLQQKAQVFSLESNAAVRSRLTHSFEVAQTGRFIAEQIATALQERLKISINAQAFANFVETACLMHDVGNPPFGHFGEATIAEWFEENAAACMSQALSLSADGLSDPAYQDVLADFASFDGNCQGLRIVTKLQWNRDEYGLNLTATSLAAYLKYVVSPSGISKANPLRKKAGYFTADKAVVERVWEILRMKPHTRHPVAYVMEASDDIAYCISDIEDAIENDFFSEEAFFNEVTKRWKEASKDKPWSRFASILAASTAEDKLSLRNRAFTEFRTDFARFLSSAAADAYIRAHEEILEGTAAPLLDGESEYGLALETLKQFSREWIYSRNEIGKVELAGHSVLRGLLDAYHCILSCSKDRFEAILERKNRDTTGQRIVIEHKLFGMLPSKHVLAYKHAIGLIPSGDLAHYSRLEWLNRAHLVVDYISGMTDTFALSSFQNLSGIQVK